MSNGETVRISHGICAMGEETGHQYSLRWDESSLPSPQPTERDMQTQKRKHRPRDAQPIPRRSKRIRNKIAAAAAAISAPDAVVINDNAKDNDQSNPDQVAAAIGTPWSPMHGIGKQEEPSDRFFDEENALTRTELMEVYRCTDDSKPYQVASAIGRPPSRMHEPSVNFFDEKKAPTPTELMEVYRCTDDSTPNRVASVIGRPPSPMEEPSDSCFDETKALTSMDLMEASRCTDDEGNISTTTQPDLLPAFLLAFLKDDLILDADGEEGWVMDAKEGKVMDAVKAIQDTVP
ncbi:hypothetical protein Esi_0171_0039 [Ectocarpus siliculosus]|uniref:Uncharacterized protein n=1 Tax=Ectocarpus siliculosus TaxID=2880 RepID=D7FMW0_ECTSI|nr:hypothetical protein Esi_0171_0039 [Ectocarpus siliculosus]|eukprot:CBJ30024.1 hypothetical protein Esi_0171_0039 [Ectocarpus siliculosus]